MTLICLLERSPYTSPISPLYLPCISPGQIERTFVRFLEVVPHVPPREREVDG